MFFSLLIWIRNDTSFFKELGLLIFVTVYSWISALAMQKISCWRWSYGMPAVLPLRSISLTHDSLSTFILCCAQQPTVASIYAKYSQMFFMAYCLRELLLFGNIQSQYTSLCSYCTFFLNSCFICMIITTSWLSNNTCGLLYCIITIHIPDACNIYAGLPY